MKAEEIAKAKMLVSEWKASPYLPNNSSPEQKSN